MPLPPDLFDRAFEIWQEFGPERGRPVEVRWAERLPDLRQEDYAEAIGRCRAVEASASGFVAAALHGDLAEADARARFQASVPDLTDERVSRTWSQAYYFALK